MINLKVANFKGYESGKDQLKLEQSAKQLINHQHIMHNSVPTHRSIK